MMTTDKILLFASDLERLYGIPQSTWRYWAHVGKGPSSYCIGRRRVWDRDIVANWLAVQRAAGQLTTAPAKSTTPESGR